MRYKFLYQRLESLTGLSFDEVLSFLGIGWGSFSNILSLS